MNLGTLLYDGAGNIKSFGSRLFAYDRVSRLTEANLQPFSKAQSYTFDSFGNLNSITTTDSTDPLKPVTTPRPIGVSTATNRLTGASYDGSGNVTSLFTLTSFEYDPFNRVTHLAGTGVNKSFLYDTSDNRVAILDHQAQTEEWHLRGLHDRVVRSYLSSPEGWSWKQDWVYRDGQLVGSTSPAKWREYHLDHLGSPRLVTGPIGLKVAEHHPFPFGEMASENGPGVDESENLFRYTGHERDANCEDGSCAPEGQDDLDYMLARLYSPVVGRFLGVDPSGESFDPTAPQSWNRYSYVQNRPVLAIDPSGEVLRLTAGDRSLIRDLLKIINGGLVRETLALREDNTLVLILTRPNAAETPEQRALADLLRKAIQETATIELKVVSGDSGVFMDRFIDGSVDIQDLNAIGLAPPPGANAVFAHALHEQTKKAVAGLPSNELGHNFVHPLTEPVLEKISGFQRMSRDLSGFDQLTLTGSVKSVFKKGSATVTVTIFASGGNITKVERK